MTVPIIKLIPPELTGGKTYYANSNGEILNAHGYKLKHLFSPAMRTHKGGSCYPRVQLGKKNLYVHLLVCAAFWGLPKPGHVCHHLDGDKFNNRPDNLIWVHRELHPKYDRWMRQGQIFRHIDTDLLMEREMSRHQEC